MLNNGGFSRPCNSPNSLTTTTASVCSGTSSFSTSFANKPLLSLFPNSSSSSATHIPLFKTAPFFSYSQQFQQTHMRFRAVLGEKHNGLCVFARKNGRQESSRVVEAEEDLEDDFDDEEYDFEEEEDDDEDVEVDFHPENMKKWLVRKPSGFGGGKAYDTSVEDKLLEELEKSRQAQAANIRNLKLNPVNPNSKKGNKKQKEPEVVPTGIRVRVVNLPKKKNIHRDLESAFKGFPGIIKITPAVSGNKKTRDPICKGLAFVDFKSEQDASRFIQTFSGQTIAFGKVQKQVKYEMMNSATLEKSSNAKNFAPQPRLPILEKKQDTKINMGDSSREENSDDSNSPDDEHITDQMEDQYIEDHKLAEMEDIEGDDFRVAGIQDSEDEELLKAEMEDTEDDDELITSETEDTEDDELITSEMEDTEDDELVTSETEDTEDDELVTAEMEDIEDDELVTSEMEDIEDDELVTSEMEDTKDDMEHVSVLELNSGGSMEPRTKSPDSSSSLKQLAKLEANKKRLIAKGKGEKIQKVKNIRENLSRVSLSKLSDGDCEKLRTKSEQRDRIKALEQRLLAKMGGEKIPKLDIPGTAKGLKSKEKVVQQNESQLQEKTKRIKKKQHAKGKGEKVQKLVVPGSAKRLGIKEKAVLKDVFKKYAAKGGVLASKEEN